jgi:hypothetical protein
VRVEDVPFSDEGHVNDVAPDVAEPSSATGASEPDDMSGVKEGIDRE